MLAGIRILDKSSQARENFFRIEIWTKFSDTQSGLVTDMRKHLEENYIQMMVDDATTYNNKNKDTQGNLSEWIKF